MLSERGISTTDGRDRATILKERIQKEKRRQKQAKKKKEDISHHRKG
jgi:hypothetical protein